MRACLIGPCPDADAIAGISLLARGWHTPTLVPLDQIEQVVQLQHVSATTLRPGTLVRILRSPLYRGDLGIVHTVDLSNDMAGIKLIPRIDLSSVDATGAAKGKTPAGQRVPQRLFNRDEIEQLGGHVVIRPSTGECMWRRNAYQNGVLIKRFPLSALSADNVNPTFEELNRFHEVLEPGRYKELLLASSSSLQSHTFSIGDAVEIIQGEAKYLTGTVQLIDQHVHVLLDNVTVNVRRSCSACAGTAAVR